MGKWLSKLVYDSHQPAVVLTQIGLTSKSKGLVVTAIASRLQYCILA